MEGEPMELSRFTRIAPCAWRIERQGPMRVPAILYATEALIRDMDDKVYEQASNVAALPGIEEAAYVMPDAHWGYGFPIGGVAAFDPRQGGVVSAGGVGFDISCGVRTYTTGIPAAVLGERLEPLAHDLYRTVPAGVGSEGDFRLP